MLVIIYLFLLIFLLVLFIFFTAIGLTLKLKVLSLKENKEFGGIFTVKWLLFSHTFLIEEPKAKKTPFEEPEKSKTEKVVIVEKGDRQDKKGFEHTEKKADEILKTEREEIIGDKEKTGSKEKTGDKEKTRLIDRIRGKKRVKTEDKEESKKLMTTREMLYWGMEAFKSLRKPLFRLFSDLLNGIKIKRLESCMTFGLSDPADTGLLCGLIHSIAGFFYSRCRHCSFSINPVFLDPMLDFQGSVEIRVKIYSLFLPFIKFIFNWKTLSFTYSLVKEILQREWKSTWKPRWKSAWKSTWKSNS
jgi:hypothetical protein